VSPHPSLDLERLRRRLSTAADQPDDVIADVLTAGYAHLLELEADHLSAGRRVDELLASGDDEHAIYAAVREQRLLSGLMRGLRTDLAELAAIRRNRRAVGPLQHGR
jgi:hypothetical protein